MFADASISDTAGVIFAVLAASLLGSLHCAGMCGGLVLFAVGSDGTFKRRARLHVAYHGGRGLAYIALGIFAGLLGATADLAITSGDGIRTSAIVAGLGMITLGLITLAPSIGLRGVRARLPAPIRALIDGIHGWAFRLPPTARAASVGILTPMLPCGWLYAFVIVAAGTGSMIFGGVV
ncbi:MAG: sulfite exporter TauE/SafE family protein, partial [Planctomycetota bacterium]